MKYEPSDTTALILEQAYNYVQRAPYRVTARWVFYRLLQDAILTEKADYKKLLGFLSKARKGFYGNWTPYTLADPTRSARVRGGGFDDGQEWVNAVANTTECHLDRWASQDNYVEIWFEAAAMQGQFEFHADENIPLLAFHGDVSIPEKWEAAVRLLRRWWSNPRPIIVLYYGDLDPKGLQIPQSARRDILTFVGQAMQDVLHLPFDFPVHPGRAEPGSDRPVPGAGEPGPAGHLPVGGAGRCGGPRVDRRVQRLHRPGTVR